MKSRRFQYILSMFLLFFLLPTIVLAKEEITLKADQTDLEMGDVVTIQGTSSSLSNKKLYALTATFSYDQAIFEAPEASDFITLDDSLKVTYSTQTQKLGFISKTGQIPSTLFRVQLKVKKKATVGNTYIGLTNITISDGEEKRSLPQSTLQLLVTRDALEDEVLPINQPNQIQEAKETVMTVLTTMPIIQILAVILIGLASVAIYFCLFKRHRNRLIIVLLSIGGISFLALSSLCFINFRKKDVNQDGERNYEDAENIMSYILEGEEEIRDANKTKNASKQSASLFQQRFQYDYNNDGYIDVKDVANSVQQTTEASYRVELSARKEDSVYVEKQAEQIILNFHATISPKETIQKVEVNHQYYPVTNMGTYYSVSVTAPKSSGVHTFQFSKVLLSNQREIKTNFSLKKEILKAIPYVDLFNINDDKNVLTFRLEDQDDAFLDGEVSIMDDSGVEIFNEALKQENRFEYPFEEEKMYSILVTASYDLDTDEFNDKTGQQNLYKNKEIYSHSFSVDSHYEFIISDVMITDAIEKGEKPKVSFNSSNNKNLQVDYIVVDEKEYDITAQQDSHYEVLLDDIDTSTFGKYQVDIDQVVLNNYKSFQRTTDYEIDSLTYHVLKHAPTVHSIALQNQQEDKVITATYTLDDTDKTLQKLNAVLVDSTDKIIDIQEDIAQQKQLTFSYQNSIDGRYRVKFLATYNLGTDRHTYQDKNIGEEEILTQMDIYITQAVVKNYFPTKGEPKYTVFYQVSLSEALKNSVSYNELAGVTLNGLNYDGNKGNNYSTTISFTVPSESGVVDLKVDRVKLRYENYQGVSSAFFSVKPSIVQIDVLKDAPTIENLQVLEEDYANQSTTFQFDVVDDKGGFESGEVEFNHEIQSIERGTNTITFHQIPQDETLQLNFYGDYDLDTNTLKDQDPELNKKKHQLLKTISYGLYQKEKYDQIVLQNMTATSHLQNQYFEKNEEVPVHFTVAGLEEDFPLSVDKVVIKNQVYDVQQGEEDSFVVMKGFTSAGVKEIEIQEIIFDNGKRVSLKAPASVQIEVLKDPIRVEDFKYHIEQQKMTLHFALKDVDKSVMGALKENVTIKIFNEDNEELKSIPYQEEVTLPLEADQVRYYVHLYANYDRDIRQNDGCNAIENEKLLDEVISLDQNYIEIKDILDVALYKIEGENTTSVETVHLRDLQDHLEDYFVEISFKNMPSIRSKIKKVVSSDGLLVLVLDYQYVTKENDKEATDLRIEFGHLQEDVANNENHPQTFEDFVNQIKAQPDGHFVLKNDLDASRYETDDLSMLGLEFTGTLDGNGHTIKNLTKPLFESLNHATIQNIKFSIVKLPSSNAKGTLANTASDTTIRNVLIDDFVKTNSEKESGVLVGKVSNHSTIEECRVTNFTLSVGWMVQQVGGLVGVLDTSTVQNSYVIGKLSASWNYVSSFIGEVKGQSTLTNNYTKVTYSNSDAIASCGFACASSNTLAQNNISLNEMSGKITHPFISGFNKNSKGNYYLESERYPLDKDGVINITQDQVNTPLFQEAQFDESIWNLQAISYETTPTFLIEKPSVINREEAGEDYDETKETLYQNLLALMPFYGSQKIVKSALNIDETHLLSQQEMMHLVPLDETGNVVTYLTSDHPDKIKKIKIVFKNQDKLEYAVRYERTYDMVASYRISDLKIDYTFNHYIIDSHSQLVNNLTNYLATFTYQDNLDPLTVSADSRIYREYYEDVTRHHLKEFVYQFLSNSNYTNMTHDEAIDNYLEKEIKKDQKLEKVLYVYNYFKRFYSIDIDGMMLNDFLLFHAQGFDKNMNMNDITTAFLANEKNMELNATNDTYERLFAKYTKLSNITDFLAYLVQEFGHETPAEWYANQFKGYLVEFGVPDNPEIMYTLWDHLSHPDKNTGVKWYNYTLPIVTLPKNAAYVISSPTQFIIGAQRTYIAQPDDPVQQSDLQARIASYVARMKDYYTTAYRLLEDKKYFNNIHTVQIDKRYTYDENGILIFQNPYTTQEPFHKNFNEVIGQWAYNDYNAATANGAYIIWRVEGLMDGRFEDGYEYTFHTWSHETAHNIDARLFLKDNSRRFDAGGEDYADGNLTQSFGDGDIVMNLSRHLKGTTSNISANLEPGRIDSPVEIHDFYKKLFDTLYIMDYLEGRAFLKLSSKEQSKIAVQAFYPDENKYTDEKLSHINKRTTVYHEIDEAAYQDMHLTEIDDLYKNQLVIFPTVIYSTYGTNRYGGENIYKVHWYQPNNPEGRPDSYSIKWFAYEMLGYKGYNEGYIEYYSNIGSTVKEFYRDDNPEKGTQNRDYKTDLDAIRTITGDETMTFDRYKGMRFQEVEEHLEDIQVIDVNQVFVEFYEALKADAAHVIEVEKQAWEKYPGTSDDQKNARNKMISEAKKFEKSTAVRRKVYYALKNQTNDFEGAVYDSSKKHQVGDFVVPQVESVILEEVSPENELTLDSNEEEYDIVESEEIIEEDSEVIEEKVELEQQEETEILPPIEEDQNMEEQENQTVLPDDEKVDSDVASNPEQSQQEEILPGESESDNNIVENEEQITSPIPDDATEDKEPEEDKIPTVPEIQQDGIVEKKNDKKTALDDPNETEQE